VYLDDSVRAVLPMACNLYALEREDESLRLFPYPNLYASMYTLAL
jgi:hypothetical protein